ncbi:small nuclear ribonucleoprotein Sm D3 [Bonamia ostreae]|uniref:Small nuclear ribonucleoprotein Sm D3 n=1 Tax=Bonamia ostreae TaxID=126728 RepID=A0ABV2AJJ1_9EUKA
MPVYIGVPIKILHEAEGYIATVEMKTYECYRGQLSNVEDCMNIELINVTYTAHDGQVKKRSKVYIRGSFIKLIIIPDMLKNAPVFKRIENKMTNDSSNFVILQKAIRLEWGEA